MDFTLDKKHEMARTLFKEFAETEVKPLAQETDETEQFPAETVAKMAKYGLGSSPAELMILAIGTIVAFAVSMFIIKFLMNYIKKHDFKVFGWYRIALGILVIVLSLVNVI